MIDWWSSLLIERQIFYAIGLVSLSILLVQILLTVVGIDARHGDADLSGHGDHGSGLGLLTIRTVTAFFVGFGWGGVILLNHGYSVPVAIIGGTGTGLVFLLCTAFLIRNLLRLQSSGNLDYRNAIGVVGTVYTTIPAAETAGGQLEEAYSSEQKAESQRAERDKATQYANVVVPAEISRDRLLVEAEAQAEQTRRMQQGAADGQRAIKQAEADGLLFVRRAEAEGLKAKLLAEADGTEAILTKKAAGFRDLIDTCGGPAGAQNMLITEQLPNLVHEQVNAISNLKIDELTVWDSGKNGDGKTGTADFLSGMISALPPLHELARNAGLDLPTYLGQLKREGEKRTKNSAQPKSSEAPSAEPPAAQT